MNQKRIFYYKQQSLQNEKKLAKKSYLQLNKKLLIFKTKKELSKGFEDFSLLLIYSGYSRLLEVNSLL